jgi:sugar O-acyltransferase (sialic acid O-acetyltransferase NeuD family)
VSKPVVVLGAGGHARVLVGMLKSQGVEIRALIAPKFVAAPEFACLSHYEDDSDIERFDSSEINLVNGIGSLPNQADLRKRLFIEARNKGYRFKTLTDSSAVVSKYAELAEGVQIFPGAIVNGCLIGENSIVNSGAIVEHDVRIGTHCHIAPGAVVCGDVTLGDGVHIGAGATVIQGMTIGDGATVGAGAILTRDLSENDTLYSARSVARSAFRKGNK